MFKTPLMLQALKEPGEWALTAPLRWLATEQRQLPAKLRDVIVPKQFITDLASIPRMLRGGIVASVMFKMFGMSLDVTGPSRRPAVLHDWLYCLQRSPRELCDEVLRLALIAEGMPAWQARLYYLAVRAGGWVVWNARKRKTGGLSPADFLT